MQKLINNPNNMVSEAIGGFVKCYPKLVEYTKNKKVLKYVKAPLQGKVGVVTGGGAGHDPAMYGYIGRNMLDAVAVGEIFYTPSAEDFYTAFKAADSGHGVACLYGNYKNDRVAVEKAVKLAAKDGITVKTVIAKDDVAIAEKQKRRGLAGEILMWKCGGAAASLGYSLDEVIRLAHKAITATRSIGVGLSSCIIPAVGRPNYIIEEGTMEIGIGHHGAASFDTCKLKTADATAEIMINAILADMPLKAGQEVAVMISGMGNTTMIELNIIFSKIYDILQSHKIKIYHSGIGNYFTSLDMMGATVTVMKLDDELKRMMDVPALTPAFKGFNQE
jgi:dihydroxyacetone kinase-like protein